MVYKLAGAIPACNFLRIPKQRHASLRLTGQHLYAEVRANGSQVFVFHFDVATTDNLVIRISFSNMFKTMKVQKMVCYIIYKYQYIIHILYIQIHRYLVLYVCSDRLYLLHVYLDVSRTFVIHVSFFLIPIQSNGSVIQYPLTLNRWTVLHLNLPAIMGMHTNRGYLCLKGVHFCSTLAVRNVFVSGNNYKPEVRNLLKYHGQTRLLLVHRGTCTYIRIYILKMFLLYILWYNRTKYTLHSKLFIFCSDVCFRLCHEKCKCQYYKDVNGLKCTHGSLCPLLIQVRVVWLHIPHLNPSLWYNGPTIRMVLHLSQLSHNYMKLLGLELWWYALSVT